MSQYQIAICDDATIYGIGADIDAAIANAADYGAWNGETPRVVPMAVHSSYDGGIVDLTNLGRLSGDGEAISGADGKARRITAELAELVRTRGGNVVFDIRRDGVLDIAA